MLKTKMLFNGELLIDTFTQGTRHFFVTDSGNKVIVKNLSNLSVFCTKCNKETKVKKYKPHYIDKPFLCGKCSAIGRSAGRLNGMYGKSVYQVWVEKYGEEEASKRKDLRSKKQSLSSRGKNNPFYGKHHSKDLQIQITNKVKDFYKNNQEKVLETGFLKLNLSYESLVESFNLYKTTSINKNGISKKYNIDSRTIEKYWLFKGIVNEEDLREIHIKKKIGEFGSSKEQELLTCLNLCFPKIRVKQALFISGYYYDFLLNNKVIVEYDGYYWHNINESRKSKDSFKDKLAIDNGYKIYRVKETIDGDVDLINDLTNIKRLLNEI